MHRWLVLLPVCLQVVLLSGPVASAQPTGLPAETLPLSDLSAFRDAPSNWSTADSVWADPEEEHHLAVAPGSGILVNRPEASANGHLLTAWTHGDLEIEMDVLMPRGSNSGIYLQGRYEIQLLDSWGVRSPTYADMGGIYQRWRPDRPEGERGIGGQAPRSNVAKAPGLWQHLKIDFRAPRFNADGEKVENARFEKVVLNGVVIHRNIELRGPTRAAAFTDEAAHGPLMIQGDHGPVAIKDVRYKRYEPGAIGLSDLQYARYDARLDEGLQQLDTIAVAERGATDRLSHEVVGGDNAFAAVFEGTLQVPRSGRYGFDLALHWVTGDPHFDDQVIGGGRLEIGGETALVHAGTGRVASETIDLNAGAQPFRLVYFKARSGGSSRIALFAEGPRLRRRALTTGATSGPPGDPILLRPEARPTVLRGFYQHGTTKKTHAVSVGDPQHIHYAYDLAQGSLLRVWKGPFVQANAMWQGRGIEQRVASQGSGPTVSGAPPLALLPTPTAAWPDSVQPALDHEYLGYRLDAQGRPTFRYRVQGLMVEDRLRADGTGGHLVRRIRLTGASATDRLFVRLFRADTLRTAGPSRFVAGDRDFYVELLSAPAKRAQLRRSAGGRELLLPVSTADLPIELHYAIIW
ncbi:MAG: DUF1080 domain-containing protein [Bacteroidetes bacterium]|jgi:hypothetical protein|nr:DUF1080 domain-containing protein [Bacteroidota bacterium]